MLDPTVRNCGFLFNWFLQLEDIEIGIMLMMARNIWPCGEWGIKICDNGRWNPKFMQGKKSDFF